MKHQHIRGSEEVAYSHCLPDHTQYAISYAAGGRIVVGPAVALAVAPESEVRFHSLV